MNIEEVEEILTNSDRSLNRAVDILKCEPSDAHDVLILNHALSGNNYRELLNDSEKLKKQYDFHAKFYYDDLIVRQALKIQKLGYAEDVFGDIKTFFKFFWIDQLVSYNTFTYVFGMVENNKNFEYYTCVVSYYGIIYDISNGKYTIYAKSNCDVPKFGYIGEFDYDTVTIKHTIYSDDMICLLYGGYYDAIKKLTKNFPNMRKTTKLHADIDVNGNCLYYDHVIEKYHAYAKLPHLI